MHGMRQSTGTKPALSWQYIDLVELLESALNLGL